MTVYLREPVGDPLESSFEFWVFDLREHASRAFLHTPSDGPRGGDINLAGWQLAESSSQLLHAWQVEIGFATGAEPLRANLLQPQSSDYPTLSTLAVAGNYAYRVLLEAMDPDLRVLFAESVARFVRGDLERLAIFSDALVPWRLFYVDPTDPDKRVDDNTTVDHAGFLGAAGAVDLQPVSVANGRTGVEIPMGVNEGLRREPGGEADLLALFERPTRLKPLLTSDHRQLLKYVVEGSPALVYALAHGQFRSLGGVSVQELDLGRRPWSALALKTALDHRGRLSTSPIVFVNACQAGLRGTANGGRTVAEAFLEAGAAATLAPLLEVPVIFGSWFGVEVLRELITGVSLNEAVLAVTRHALTEYANPLGLAYSISLGTSRLVDRNAV